MTNTRLTPGAISLSTPSHFPPMEASKLVNPVTFPPGRAKLSMKPLSTGSATLTKTIGIAEVIWRSAANSRVALDQDDIRCQRNQLFGERRQPFNISSAPPKIDANVAARGPAQPFKPLLKRHQARRSFRIAFGACTDDADAVDFSRLLRARCERPRARRRRATKSRDELAPSHHSITSSARADSPGDTSMPSIFAVFKLITNSNLVGCITGRSLGLAPLRMRAT